MVIWVSELIEWIHVYSSFFAALNLLDDSSHLQLSMHHFVVLRADRGVHDSAGHADGGHLPGAGS